MEGGEGREEAHMSSISTGLIPSNPRFVNRVQAGKIHGFRGLGTDTTLKCFFLSLLDIRGGNSFLQRLLDYL